ncbi:ATP-binding cassette domain-containing protein [Nakamurella silvestris]|nr:ATP-binding cassette domain-containing protein [Nakamurella silvestris]
MDEILLSCSNVSKSYGGVAAVRAVGLELRAGEILGLIGPNGAGKTTLVDVITGQQTADTGVIRIGTVSLTGPPSRRARLAGFARTFQHPQLALDMTVRENILIGAVPDRFSSPWRVLASAFSGAARPATPEIDDRITDLAAELNISALDRMCADLTLGEQRLVEVARALLRGPTVLLLDEPFAGGDPRGVEGMIHALTRIVERGCGVLVVDHNVDIVASLVDRLVLMDQGQVVFDGLPTAAMASQEMRTVYFGSGT